MSSEESDIELPSALPEKQYKQMPASPTEELLKKNNTKNKTPPKLPDIKNEDKKLTTKLMIYQALIDLKSRKGVSLYAIKKYLKERYNVDTEKLNYVIKKSIKNAVQEGTIVQLKGIGASGSFKLVPVKEKKKPKPKKAKIEKQTKETKEKPKTSEKPKKPIEKSMKKSEKVVKLKTKSKKNKSDDKPVKLKKKVEKEKVDVKDVKIVKEKGKKMKIAKGLQTPSKKKASMLKRKSIGSIIKPPKMKPKGKA